MFSSILRGFLRFINFQTVSKIFSNSMTGFFSNVDRKELVSALLRRSTMPSPKEIVTKAITEHDVVIFSKKSCPYCKMAKDVFKKINKPFNAIEIDDMEEMSGIQDALLDLTGARTVPRVFVKGEFIGGGSDVKNMLESGELVKLF